MADTYSDLIYHCIWATKNRRPLITAAIEQDVWRILSATASHHQMALFQAGGIEDHVHILLRLPTTISIADAMRLIKSGASKFINQELWADKPEPFGWQDGYAAFTVSRSQISAVRNYIVGQREHHRVRSFQEEYREFLDKHQIPYKPEYLYD